MGLECARVAVRSIARRSPVDLDGGPMLDVVMLARKSGGGGLERPVPVASGVRADGKVEIIDNHAARGFAEAWPLGLRGADRDADAGIADPPRFARRSAGQAVD